MRIACLHTAASNISVFETAAKALGIGADVLRHEVRADLLAAAENAGHLSAEICASTASALLALAEQADAVVLTCSTLGPAVEGISSSVPILRTDEALAASAVQAGGKIAVLCAVETTLEPTARLFHKAALQSNAVVEVRLVPGAWRLFKTGDNDGYLATIAKAADAAYRDGMTRVALGQASMSAAAVQVTAGPLPLTSAAAGLAAAMRAVALSAVVQPLHARLER
ncbi:Asp/Glu racemase [Pseudomonas sp. CFBP13509]|uniref:aspartate/glutamate racemase family protein n=1 Tax=Pseudomonas sp. CFBP13509 TaxID=2184008 RepID=UPI0010BF87F6|nr:aspartate/glutamate racemase family protein [Pseudomonas sp. CFBP13509]TKJ77698.1 Asp/Glu racemase [Pseudomonas sp. CFBP13509]